MSDAKAISVTGAAGLNKFHHRLKINVDCSRAFEKKKSLSDSLKSSAFINQIKKSIGGDHQRVRHNYVAKNASEQALKDFLNQIVLSKISSTNSGETPLQIATAY